MRLPSLSAVLLALLAYPVWAAKWDVVPAFSVTETYTDNLRLVPDELAQGEFVTQLIPEIAASANGKKLRFNFDYAPELTFYARGLSEDEIFHRLNALGTAELADKLLFIDAGATVSQYDVTLQGAQSDNNVNVTGNRATVGTFYLSPYLSHHFGTSAVALARFTYSAWNSNDVQSFNNTADTIELDLSSGPEYRVLTGNLNYMKANIDYDRQPDLAAEIVLATGRRLITPTVGLLAQVGDENYERVVAGQPTGVKDGGSRWGVGLEWVPSTRTQLTAAMGERFFGDAYLLDIAHRTRLLTLRAGYNQDVTTTRTEFFTGENSGAASYLDPLYCTKSADPEACKQDLNSVVSTRGLPVNTNGPVNFFSAAPFLQERFQVSVAMQGVKNVVIATVFTDSRKDLPGFALVASNDVDQNGINFAWNLPMGARTFWNMGATYSLNKFRDTGREDNVTTFRMDVRRQLQQRLAGSVGYRGQQRDSSVSAASYTENVLWATLRMEF
jgi:uncharacterized protein (PEP-CTERM system associated)